MKTSTLPGAEIRKRLLTPKELLGFGQDAASHPDPTIHARFIALFSPATWLIAGYVPATDCVLCYADLYGQGAKTGQYGEWGWQSLAELESLMVLPDCPRVERTPKTMFKARPFSECVDARGKITV